MTRLGRGRTRAVAFGAFVALFLGWVLAAAMAEEPAAQGPPFETMTAVVSIEWPAPEFVMVGLEVFNVAGPRPENPGGAVAARVAGCLPVDGSNYAPNDPLIVRVGAPLVNVGFEASDPGTYSVVAYFGGYCGFITDDPRFEAAVARYPDGSTIPVTVTVEFYGPNTTASDVYTLVGNLPVALDTLGDITVTLGQFTIDETSGSVPDGGGAPAGSLGVVDGSESLADAVDTASAETSTVDGDEPAEGTDGTAEAGEGAASQDARDGDGVNIVAIAILLLGIVALLEALLWLKKRLPAGVPESGGSGDYADEAQMIGAAALTKHLAGVASDNPPAKGKPGWTWRRAGSGEVIDVIPETGRVAHRVKEGQWYQTLDPKRSGNPVGDFIEDALPPLAEPVDDETWVTVYNDSGEIVAAGYYRRGLRPNA